MSCRLLIATDDTTLASNTSPPPPAPITPAGTIAPSDIGNPAQPATPAMIALPVVPGESTNSTGSLSGVNGPLLDASNLHKFYTFTAELRETYDTNVGTTDKNSQASEETSFTPSVLVSFPMEDTNFSASYSFGATYYTQTAGTGNQWQYTNNFNAQLSHDFSERLKLTANDVLLDSPEPNIYGTTGTPYRDGQNISNAFTAAGSMQWTPLIGTSTTYSNTIVRYLDNPSIAASQDSMENSASQSIGFTVLPTVSVNFGGVIDNTTYDSTARGYSSYSGFVGGSWSPLDNVSASLSCGGSYTETEQTQAKGQGNTNANDLSPYVNLSASWKIGGHSSLSGTYAHEITPSDYAGSNAQESDRLSAELNYTVNSRISTYLQLSYTVSDTSGALTYTRGTPSYTETVYGVDTGISYNFVKYFSLTFDISESGVSSGLPGMDYNRAQVGVGIRGTY